MLYWRSQFRLFVENVLVDTISPHKLQYSIHYDIEFILSENSEQMRNLSLYCKPTPRLDLIHTLINYAGLLAVTESDWFENDLIIDSQTATYNFINLISLQVPQVSCST